jgi:regulator of chromosome condensation (RCC1) repeat-containing protein
MEPLRSFGLLFFASAVGLAASCGSRTGLLIDHLDEVDGAAPPSDAATDDELTAHDAAAPLLDWAVGFSSVCMLQSGGRAGCFAFPSEPTESAYDVQLEPVEGVEGATAMAGREGFCALLGDGTVTCWDRLALDGGLANGPAEPVAGLVDVKQLDVSDPGRGGFGCAVRTDGSVWCWGSNLYNALGRGSHDQELSGPFAPGPVVELNGAVEVAVSSIQACARTGSGDVRCWGRVGLHQPADLSTDINVPILVPAAQGAVALALSEGETVATLSDTLIYFGHPMMGEGPDAPNPKREPRASGEQVYGSQYNTFCTKAPGAPVHCRGGIGLTDNFGTTEYDVPGTEGAIDVSVSTFTACARFSESELLCWGQYTIGPTRIHVD